MERQTKYNIQTTKPISNIVGKSVYFTKLVEEESQIKCQISMIVYEI